MTKYRINNTEAVFDAGKKIEIELFYQTAISGIAQNEIELDTEDLRYWGKEIDKRINELQEYKKLVKSNLFKVSE